MPGLMLDTDNTALLATAPFAYARLATYADLMTPAIEAEFRGRLIVIDRGHGDPMSLATVADIEDQLLTVEQGAAKIRQWNAEHRPFPTAYHDRALWAAVDAALAGVPHYTWVSTLDMTIVPDGRKPDAVQFAGAAAIGFHADLSIVWNDNWCPIRPAVSWAQWDALSAAAAALSTDIRRLA